MMKIVPFAPAGKATVALVATTASTTAVFQNIGTGFSHNSRIYNSGPNDCAIEFGDSSVQATFPLGSTASSMVLRKNSESIFSTRVSTMAGICTGANSTATIYITPGDGI